MTATSDRPASQEGVPALVLDHVTVAFDGVRVLEDVDGCVHEGDSVALIGPNGAGKSTLLRAILGLVPLASGHIEVLGTTPKAARPRVGYVPQSDQLDPEFPITASQVVLMGRYPALGWFRRPARSDRRAAADALDRVGLASEAGKRFGTLSGGQRQRVLIARAICQDARLLLLDEPFNGVDAATQESILQLLAELRSEGVAVVMPTHDLSVAHLACGAACILNRRQIAFGPIGEVLDADVLRRSYDARALVHPGDPVIVAHGPGFPHREHDDHTHIHHDHG
jgi:manganese/iron transport system ATP-binding protein